MTDAKRLRNLNFFVIIVTALSTYIAGAMGTGIDMSVCDRFVDKWQVPGTRIGPLIGFVVGWLYSRRVGMQFYHNRPAQPIQHALWAAIICNMLLYTIITLIRQAPGLFALGLTIGNICAAIIAVHLGLISKLIGHMIRPRSTERQSNKLAAEARFLGTAILMAMVIGFTTIGASSVRLLGHMGMGHFEYMCVRSLQEINTYLDKYQTNHQGANPPTLPTLVETEIGGNGLNYRVLWHSDFTRKSGYAYIYRGADLTSGVPAEMVIVHDMADRHEDGLRNLLFANGKVKTLQSIAFQQAIMRDNELRRELGLPTKTIEPDMDLWEQECCQLNLYYLYEGLGYGDNDPKTMREMRDADGAAHWRRYYCPCVPKDTEEPSYHLHASAKDPGRMIAYEIEPHHQGRRHVLFGGPEVRLMTEDEFQAALQADIELYGKMSNTYAK